MADSNKQNAAVDRREAPKGAPDGTPLATTRPKGVEPGADVSHADVDLSAVSLDSQHSTTVPAPEQNPLELRPAPGHQSVEILGVPSKDA